MIRRSISTLKRPVRRGPTRAGLEAEDDLDQFVSAFEDSRTSATQREDLADFLPSSRHPQYLDILCEIVRIDLEFHWRRRPAATARRLSREVPGTFCKSANLEAVCFEEYRLRRLAGETVSPREYEMRYCVDTGFWAVPDACSSRRSRGRSHAAGMRPAGMPRVRR